MSTNKRTKKPKPKADPADPHADELTSVGTDIDKALKKIAGAKNNLAQAMTTTAALTGNGTVSRALSANLNLLAAALDTAVASLRVASDASLDGLNALNAGREGRNPNFPAEHPNADTGTPATGTGDGGSDEPGGELAAV